MQSVSKRIGYTKEHGFTVHVALLPIIDCGKCGEPIPAAEDCVVLKMTDSNVYYLCKQCLPFTLVTDARLAAE